MIENFKTESKRYSLLHMKNKGEIEDLNKNKQIEKIKNVFKDNDVDGKITTLTKMEFFLLKKKMNLIDIIYP